MGALVLLAGTPRAGRWNHRLLVPPGFAGGAPLAAAAVEAARDRPAGANYLSSSAAVSQPATGRAGREVLVLFGVDVARLGPGRRRRVEAALGLLLEELGAAVAGRDWEAPGERLAAEAPELGAWLGAPEFRGLPRHRVADRPLPGRPAGRPRRAGAWAAVAAALAALALAAAVWLAPPRPGVPPGAGPAAGGDGPGGAAKRPGVAPTPAERYGRLLRDLGRADGAGVREELWALAAGAPRAGGVPLADLLARDEVRELLEGWSGPESLDPFVFLGGPAAGGRGREALAALLPPAGGDAAGVAGVRRELAELAGALAELRREAECLDAGRAGPSAYLRLVRRAAAVAAPPGAAAAGPAPLPFFGPADAAALAALEDFLVESGEAKGLWRALDPPAHVTGLRGALSALGGHVSGLRRLCDDPTLTRVHRAALGGLLAFFERGARSPLARP